MTPATRSYNACLLGAFLLVALTALVFGYTIPEVTP